ncbi:AMP-binding protein [Pseudomonas segetis]|uniref:Long-chain acyl-CoA synthetase (AMP-forming) n=1 Tax=Pseudomonas segetis TaxID=298908 RepID=A0A239CS53_9PSED|nr:AMP-binding protein [Pseudomonas segetis]SNS22712.1 Long-chain acyl-CoA synthetase (AMP-forming) [Pseudomonas segetis]
MWPVAERFFQQLRSRNDSVALRQGTDTLSYCQLVDEVSARSERLLAQGVTRVALALDNGIEWVLWDLAILHAGLVCIPLPGFFSAAQQKHVMDSAGVDCLIGLPNETSQSLGFSENAEGWLQRKQGHYPELPAGTCKITYTSGTTGNPKGVCLDIATQLEVANSLYLASLSCSVERHLCILPLATLLENLAGVYAPLIAGAQVELIPMAKSGLQGASQFNLMQFLTSLNELQPHSLILLPQLLLALVTAAERGLPLPSSLRFIAVGGGRVAPQLLDRCGELGLPVFEGYGLSECASVVCLNTPEARKVGTVGKPLGHLQIRLASDGEVMIKGPHMLGYVGEAEAQDEWLASGDLGHFDGDYLVLHGRKKHQFITAYGRNVNPEWVEAELTQRLPIAQAWVQGEAMAQNVAVLVPRFPDTTDEDLAAAVQEVNQQLPDYAQVHHWLRAEQPFSVTNDMTTANGRLRRNAVQQHYQEAITHLIADVPMTGALP